MFAFMSKDQTAVRIHDEDGMSTNTSVLPSAEGPSTHERTKKLTAEELEDSDASVTCNTGLAEMRERDSTEIQQRV
jgi:hypothetical protein